MRKLCGLFILFFILSISCNKKPTDLDTTPPKITIIAPIDDVTIRDSVTIKVVIVENDAVDKVEFYIDGDLHSTINSEPFQIIWNTANYGDGPHNIHVVVTDKSGNKARSQLIQVNVAKALFSFSFNSDWLKNDEEGVVFINDEKGNLLGEAEFRGNADFEISYPETMLQTPQKVTVSVAKIMHGDYLRINTFSGIKPSHWIYNGRDYIIVNFSEQVQLNLNNIPEHDSYFASTTISLSKRSTIRSPLILYAHFNPDNIFLRLDLITGISKYYWLSGVTAGSYNIDLSQMKSMKSMSVVLPKRSDQISVYISGLISNKQRYKLNNYILKYDNEGDSLINTVNIKYPGSLFEEYKTSILLYDNGERTNYWHQTNFGIPPQNVKKIDADFEYVTIENKKVVINVAGNFILNYSSWAMKNVKGSWYMYSGMENTTHVLPELANTLKSKFSDLEFDENSFQFTRLMDYPQISSYEEYIAIIFKEGNRIYDVVDTYRSRKKSPNGLFKTSISEKDLEDEEFGF